MANQQDVEFQTIDGLTLRGRVYVSKDKGPGIVMCPGVSESCYRGAGQILRADVRTAPTDPPCDLQFNAVKEMVGLPSAAMAFQQAGITALVYDPRTTGLSDGEPRNDIDPFKQIEDYSDALTFLGGHPMVDSARMGVWGMSLAGAVGLCVASFDKRARFVIAVCPATEYQYSEGKLPSVLTKITKDRESQVKGNTPFYVPMLTEAGENPAGFNLGVDKEAAVRILSAQNELIPTRKALAPNHVNRTTIQSYHKLLMWNPAYMWKHLHSTPTMFVVPELDGLISADTQQQYFKLLPGPKKFHVQQGRGHMDILEGEGLPELMKLQVEFIHDALEGRVSRS